MFRNVCRLCLGTDNLIWVFSDKMADNMCEIIHVTSGVQISRGDPVTQMVCGTCSQVTSKMYQFRMKSMKNDKDLKAKCIEHKASEIEAKCVVHKESDETKKFILKKYKFAHPSIKEVVKKYPNIKLPDSIVKLHIGAYITLLTDEVDEYFREQNLTDEDIELLKKEAIKLADPTKIQKTKSPTKDKKILKSINSIIGGKRKRSVENVTESGTSSGDSKKKKLDDSSTEKSKPKIQGKGESGTDKINVVDASKTVLVQDKNTKKKKLDDSLTEKPKPKIQEKVKSGVDKVNMGDLLKTVLVKDKDKSAQINNNHPSSNQIKSAKCSTDTKSKSTTESCTSGKLLNGDNALKTREREKITLKSILESGKAPEPRLLFGDIIEIDDEPFVSETPGKDKKLEDASQVKKTAKIANNTEEKKTENVSTAESSFDLLISKPSVNEETSLKCISPVFDAQLFALSDTEDRQIDNNSDSDSIVVDSRTSTNVQEKSSKVNKDLFVEALELAPKTSETNTNQPDLSLVSFSVKSRLLYTCKVCDSQHGSHKELKQHARRTHTKCPFCGQRFRTFGKRDAHVVNECSKNPVKFKEIQIVLTKVDEDEEIKKKYASAFETTAQTSREEKSVVDASKIVLVQDKNTKKKKLDDSSTEEKSVIDIQEVVNVDLTKVDESTIVCDSTTQDAINELEKFLTSAEVVESTDKRNLRVPDDEIICLSDDESIPDDASKDKDKDKAVTYEFGSQKLNVINCEMLNNINIADNDFNVLKAILSQNKMRLASKKHVSVEQIVQNPILDGGTNRVKIFKNLRKLLHQYKIPIEISHGSKLSAYYKPVSQPIPNKINGLWYNLKREELRPLQVTSRQSDPAPAAVPVIVASNSAAARVVASNSAATCVVVSNSAATPVVASHSAGTCVVASNSAATPTVASNPAPVFVSKSNPPPLFASKLDLVPPLASITDSAPVTTSSKSTPAPVVFDTSVPLLVATSSSAPASVIVNNSTPSVVVTSQATTSTSQVSTPQTVSKEPSAGNDQNSDTCPVQGTGVITTTNVILAPIEVTTDSTNTGTVTSYIIVPHSLLNTTPTIQGSLPVIESVTTVSSEVSVDEPSLSTVAQLESITNSLMPGSSSNTITESVPSIGSKDNDNVLTKTNYPQQVIRVKDLKELS